MAIVDNLDGRNYSQGSWFENQLLGLFLNRWARRMSTRRNDHFILNQKTNEDYWYPTYIRTRRYEIFIESISPTQKNSELKEEKE